MRQTCSVAAAIVVLASLGNPQMANPETAPEEQCRQVPRIELRIVEIPGGRDSFGFYDAISGSPIPRIERNCKFELAVEGDVWKVVDRVTLSNFRALNGPPWEAPSKDLASRWDPEWTAIEIELPRDDKGDKSVVLTLPTSYPLAGHRLIVFDVTVTRGDFEFTFTDPWDESPG
jgi:hypothetical protein